MFRLLTRLTQRLTASYSTMASEITEFAFGKGTECPPQKPGVLRLYSMRFCPYAQRTRLVLLHKGIEHETVNIKLSHRPQWFYELNPVGRVPVLQWDGKLIYESAACNDFLDEVYPQKPLNHSDPYQRARDRQLWESSDKLIESFYSLMRTRIGEKVVYDRFVRAVNRYEKELKERGGPYFGGEKLAMVDYMMWPWFERIPVLLKYLPDIAIIPERFPKLSSWIQHMKKEPAVKATIFDDESHEAFFISYYARQWNYDYGLAPKTATAKL